MTRPASFKYLAAQPEPASGASTGGLDVAGGTERDWYVPGDGQPWHNLTVRAVVPESVSTLVFDFRWKGEEKSLATRRLRVGSKDTEVTLALDGVLTIPPAFWPRRLQVTVKGEGDQACQADQTVGSAELLVIPRLHAHLAWLLLAVFVALALLRSLAAAAMLEKSAADILVLGLGGITGATWLVGKIRVVSGWTQRVDVPLFGRFAPRATTSLLLSALFFVPVELLTSRAVVLTNRTQAATVQDLGVLVPPSESVVVWAPPAVPATSKVVLAQGKRPYGLWSWFLSLPMASRSYDIQCRQTLLAKDKARLVEGATGTETDETGVRAKQNPDCTLSPFRAVLFGEPKFDAQSQPTLASAVTQGWDPSPQPTENHFHVREDEPHPSLWVRILGPKEGRGGLEWVAATTESKGNVGVPWPVKTWAFEASDAVDGEAMGRLDAVGCGSSPEVVVLPFASDVPRSLRVTNSAGALVSAWTSARHVEALLACGEGSRLQLGLESSVEPDGIGVTLPASLGARDGEILVNGRTYGNTSCPAGSTWLGSMPEDADCESASPPPAPTPISTWQERDDRVQGWPSYWFCVPAGESVVPVRVVRKTRDVVDGVARKMEGAWRFRKQCPPTHKVRFCACMFGDKSISVKERPTQCKNGCDWTDASKYKDCDEATKCVP